MKESCVRFGSQRHCVDRVIGITWRCFLLLAVTKYYLVEYIYQHGGYLYSHGPSARIRTHINENANALMHHNHALGILI